MVAAKQAFITEKLFLASFSREVGTANAQCSLSLVWLVRFILIFANSRQPVKTLPVVLLLISNQILLALGIGPLG